MTSGIYMITCIENKKIYIGSSVNLTRRFSEHKRFLKKNDHYNSYLQNSWNLYGEESFVFSIIEKTKLEELMSREQYWIDKSKCFDQKVGFNECKNSNSTIGYKHTEEFLASRSKLWIVVKPDGEEEEVKNLKKYCLENFISSSHLYRISRGDANFYKGWHCRMHGTTMLEWKDLRSSKIKSSDEYHQTSWWLLKHKDGEEIKLKNLEKFCRERCFCVDVLRKISKGKTSNKTYKGWSCSKLDSPDI
jgi:group I intron endonuclease